MSNLVTTISPKDIQTLRWATEHLEHPSLAARLTSMVGTPTNALVYKSRTTGGVSERFEDSEGRIDAFDEWLDRRKEWAAEEQGVTDSLGVFFDLFDLSGKIARESEKYQLYLADGILVMDHPGGQVKHPLLLQRVPLLKPFLLGLLLFRLESMSLLLSITAYGFELFDRTCQRGLNLVALARMSIDLLPELIRLAAALVELLSEPGRLVILLLNAIGESLVLLSGRIELTTGFRGI